MNESPTVERHRGTDERSPEEKVAKELLKYAEKLDAIAEREANQRYLIRWASAAVCGIVLLGMGIVLYFAYQKILFPPYIEISTAYVAAVFVAPMVSITTVTIALLIAAFRKFRNEDETSGVSAVASAARTGSSLG